MQDLNKAPTDLNPCSTRILRKPTSRHDNRRIQCDDPDRHAITYHFVNGENNNSFFTLDTNGTLKTDTTFDYESNASSYTIAIQAKDELNASIERNFTVSLIDVDDEIPIITLTGEENVTHEAGTMWMRMRNWTDNIDGSG